MIIGLTGHRPGNLTQAYSNGYCDENFELLCSFCEDLFSNRMDIEYIISGMALGFDQAAAMAALRVGGIFGWLGSST